MSDYLERLQQTYQSITSGEYKNTLWAKIYKKDSTSFRAKVQDVKSFIHFDKMPWTYKDTAYWDIVKPFLIGKVYEATLLSQDDEEMRMTLSVANHTLSKKVYTRGQSYKCIVLKKHKNFLEVEAGIDSSFKNGSQIGEISTFDFWKAQDFRDIKVGDEITLSYLKHKNNDTIVMCVPEKYKGWYKQKPERDSDTLVDVTVNKSTGQTTFKVNDSHNGILRISPKMYDAKLVPLLNKYVQNLHNEDKITCFVQGTNPKTREYFLRFEPRLLVELEKLT